jgi:hypothetical protein
MRRRLWFHQPLGIVSHSRVPSPSCLVSVSIFMSSVESRTAAHLGAVLATLAQREYPSLKRRTRVLVPAYPYRRRMYYVCGTAWPRSRHGETRIPCLRPHCRSHADYQKQHSAREGIGEEPTCVHLPCTCRLNVGAESKTYSISTSIDEYLLSVLKYIVGTEKAPRIRIAQFRHALVSLRTGRLGGLSS